MRPWPALPNDTKSVPISWLNKTSLPLPASSLVSRWFCFSSQPSKNQAWCKCVTNRQETAHKICPCCQSQHRKTLSYRNTDTEQQSHATHVSTSPKPPDQVAGLLSFGFDLYRSASPNHRTGVGGGKTVSGFAFIDYNGQRFVAQVGSPVFLRSQLVTGHNSTIGVTFSQSNSDLAWTRFAPGD